jgi:hypothetical protein
MDMKFFISIGEIMGRDIIRNGFLFRKEVGTQNLLIELKEKWFGHVTRLNRTGYQEGC